MEQRFIVLQSRPDSFEAVQKFQEAVPGAIDNYRQQIGQAWSSVSEEVGATAGLEIRYEDTFAEVCPFFLCK